MEYPTTGPMGPRIPFVERPGPPMIHHPPGLPTTMPGPGPAMTPYPEGLPMTVGVPPGWLPPSGPPNPQ